MLLVCTIWSELYRFIVCTDHNISVVSGAILNQTKKLETKWRGRLRNKFLEPFRVIHMEAFQNQRYHLRSHWVKPVFMINCLVQSFLKEKSDFSKDLSAA